MWLNLSNRVYIVHSKKRVQEEIEPGNNYCKIIKTRYVGQQLRNINGKTL